MCRVLVADGRPLRVHPPYKPAYGRSLWRIAHVSGFGGGSGKRTTGGLDCWARELAKMEEPHQILGVAIDADPQAIKRAFYQKMKAHPPERDPEGFRRIRQAFEAMSTAPPPPPKRLNLGPVQETILKSPAANATRPVELEETILKSPAGDVTVLRDRPVELLETILKPPAGDATVLRGEPVELQETILNPPARDASVLIDKPVPPAPEPASVVVEALPSPAAPWTAPPDVTDLSGKPVAPESYFVKAPPASLGKLLHAQSSLLMKSRDRSSYVFLFLLVSVAYSMAVGLSLGGLQILLNNHQPLSPFNSACVAALWALFFLHYCLYGDHASSTNYFVGTEGAVRYRFRAKGTQPTETRGFRYEWANQVREIKLDAGGTQFRFLNAAGQVVHQFTPTQIGDTSYVTCLTQAFQQFLRCPPASSGTPAKPSSTGGFLGSWTPPPTVTGLNGEAIPAGSYFFSAPPAEIGRLIRAGSTLTGKPAIADGLISDLMLTFLFTGFCGGLLHWTMGALSQQLDIPAPLHWTLLGACVALALWLSSLMFVNTNESNFFIGELGAAEIPFHRTLSNVRPARILLYSKAVKAIALTTVRQNYSTLAYRFQNAAGGVVHVIDCHGSKERLFQEYADTAVWAMSRYRSS